MDITRWAQNICITFIQRRPNVFDVGPALYKCYTNVLCLLGLLTQQKPMLIECWATFGDNSLNIKQFSFVLKQWQDHLGRENKESYVALLAIRPRFLTEMRE